MFVMTAKVSKTKIAAVVTLLIALVVLVVVAVTAKNQAGSEKETLDADTNEDRVTFLAGYGWDVNAEPVQIQAVSIPADQENGVFARYNELQKSQGYDLAPYAGKQAMRYVYEVMNYPSAEEPVYATLLVYEGKVIGGDVTNTATDGLMHGFTAPSSLS